MTAIEPNELELLSHLLLWSSREGEPDAYQRWRDTFRAWEAADPSERRIIMRDASAVLRIDGSIQPVWEIFYLVQRKDKQGLTDQVIDQFIGRVLEEADRMGLELAGGSHPVNFK